MNQRPYASCYARLGIRRPVDWDRLRLAYRRAVARSHPDRSRTAKADDFQSVTAAFRAIDAYRRRHGRLPDFDTLVGEPYPRHPAHNLTCRRLAPVALLGVAALLLVMMTILLAMLWSANRPEAAVPAMDGPARVQSMQPGLRIGMRSYEVLERHGTPTYTERTVWYYGESGIVFINGCVAGWDNRSPYPFGPEAGSLSPPAEPKADPCALPRDGD